MAITSRAFAVLALLASGLADALGSFVVKCDQQVGTVDLVVDVNGYFR